MRSRIRVTAKIQLAHLIRLRLSFSFLRQGKNLLKSLLRARARSRQA